MLKGVFILLLGGGIVLNVIAKMQSGVPPSSSLMLSFGGLALVSNLVCLPFLWRFKSHDE